MIEKTSEIVELTTNLETLKVEVEDFKECTKNLEQEKIVLTESNQEILHTKEEVEKKYESTLILVDELETKNADVEKERELLELNLKTIELEKSELFEQFEKLQSESASLKCDLDEFKIITKSLEEEKASISENNATISQTKDEFETKYQSVLVIVEDLEGKKTEIEKESEAFKENIKEIQHEKEGLVLLFIKILFVVFIIKLNFKKSSFGWMSYNKGITFLQFNVKKLKNPNYNRKKNSKLNTKKN